MVLGRVDYGGDSQRGWVLEPQALGVRVGQGLGRH
jgi:hypothetical protein